VSTSPGFFAAGQSGCPASVPTSGGGAGAAGVDCCALALSRPRKKVRHAPQYKFSAHFVQAANFGLTVQASTGATRKDLLCVVAAALQAWPK
jgi:hypothetical protein